MYTSSEGEKDHVASATRDIAHNLSQCLQESDINETTRMLAIQLIGQGWDLWQKFVNPFGVLRSLIDLLYKNGFVAVAGSSPAVTANGIQSSLADDDKNRKEFIERCRQSIREIAAQNSTLLVSVLTIYIRSPENFIDARIASLRLLTSFITKQANSASAVPEKTLLDETHLPTIISNVVHLLEPSNTTTREVSATGGVSLVNEITQFLSTALQQYPSVLAFHKLQQRLAVAFPGSRPNAATAVTAITANKSNLVLGFVYDLRTGAAMAMLSAHPGQFPVPPVSNTLAVPSGSSSSASVTIEAGTSHLYDIRFSADGKHLSGLLTFSNPVSVLSSEVVVVAVWKIGFGFMSLLHNISIGLPSTTPTPSTSPLPSGAVSPVGSKSGASSPGTGGAGVSSPAPAAVVLEDQTTASKLTIYPKFVKAYRLPPAQDQGQVTLKWKTEKILSLKCGATFSEAIKISS